MLSLTKLLYAVHTWFRTNISKNTPYFILTHQHYLQIIKFLHVYIFQKKFGTEFRLYASHLANKIEARSRKRSLGGFHSQSEEECPMAAGEHVLMLLTSTASSDDPTAPPQSLCSSLCCNLNPLFFALSLSGLDNNLFFPCLQQTF